ncbi:MAG: DNA repair protein RecO [Gammaproteobacteria bacterium]|nr:DNA repair protein RecO [Gammaproteobacteria bacterium]
MTGAEPLVGAYVLHARRYRDSSLLLELLTRECGRVAAIARGALRARRPDTFFQPFQALLVGLRGRGDVLSVTAAEPAGAPVALRGRRLYCGLYLNELVQYMTARHDPVAALFDDYVEALERLPAADDVEPVLRRFEVGLLGHLGIGLELTRDAAGDPIDPAQRYGYDVSAGAVPATTGMPDTISGSTLLALHENRLADDGDRREARLLLRRVLNHHLDGRPLKSRELFASGKTS